MQKKKMDLWPTYSIFVLLVALFSGLGVHIYIENKKAVAEAKEAALIASVQMTSEVNVAKEDEWKVIYPDTKSMKIGKIEVQTSIAKTWPERIKGLSDTSFLPKHVVKLFIFDSVGFHSIWMKDMNYPIDIIWVDESLKIVHLEKEAAPESYPAAFVPKTPAKYVIETVAGFVSENSIVIGDEVLLPNP